MCVKTLLSPWIGFEKHELESAVLTPKNQKTKRESSGKVSINLFVRHSLKLTQWLCMKNALQIMSACLILLLVLN